MLRIKEIRALLHRPAELGRILRDECRQMQTSITGMIETGLQTDARDLQRLWEHLDQMCVLSNQMEAGDFMIKADRALQAAYRRLP